MPPPSQSPTSQQFHKIPLNKPPYREDNKSQSPDDHNNSQKDVIQRLQMKNLAFIPAKGQSPINSTYSNCQSIISNLNSSGSNDLSLQSQIMKISPQRIMGSSGNKMIIPANQIKIIKKDGTSPSPENRQPSLKQLSPSSITFMAQPNNQSIIDNPSNNQNMNPNIMGHNSSGSNLLRNNQKQSQKSLHQHSSKNFQPNHLSDDETNVNSDNEEKSITSMTQMKADSSNFNRPKINTQLNNYIGNQTEEAFHDNTLTQQRTQRGSQLSTQSNQNASDSHRVKIISQNKIRQSPSPPPNQVLKNNDKPPMVGKIQHESCKTQPTLNTQPSQSQLASDYIKGMINQSRTNNSLNQSITQKKVLGSGINCLKKGLISKQSFQKEMKMHGIEKDIQEVSQFVKPVIDISPPRQEDGTNNNQSQNQFQNLNTGGPNHPIKPKPPQKISLSKISHLRNYSPPPNFDQGGLSNLQEIKDTNKIATKPTDNSPTNISTTNGEEQITIPTGEGAGVFQFPFQRRARSLSLPKQDIIQNKMSQKNAVQNTNPTGDNQDKKSQSPNRQLEEQKRNKPVMAKINFAIAHKGVLQKEDDEAIFERNKEVDEWLMGSGESDNTAGSNNSNKPQMPGITVTVRSSLLNANNITKKLQSELEKPIQPDSQNNGNDDSVEEEEEDWMFRTFDKIKAGKGGKQVAKTNRTNNDRDFNLGVGIGGIGTIIPRDFNLDDDFGESPFDMAPEMQKQFSKSKQTLNQQNEDQSMLDHIASDCQDLSQFIDQIDQFMERIQ